MPSIMDRLFGRKPRTSANVSARLAAARDALADAQTRLADANARQKTAPLANDRAVFIAAKADAEAAAFDAEVAANDIAALERALLTAEADERCAAQDARADALIAEGQAVEREHEAEWDAAIMVLSRLRHVAVLHNLDVDDAEFSGAVIAGAVPRLALAGAMADFVTLDGATALPRPPESARAKAAREGAEKVSRDRQAHEERLAAARARSIEEGRARVRAEREIEDSTGRNPSDRIPAVAAHLPDPHPLFPAPR